MSQRRSGPSPRRRRQAAVAVAALVLLALAAFAPVRHNGFVGADDEAYLTGNPVVLRGLTAAGARLALTRSYAGNWHPLTWLSHMLDVELFGLDPRGHHAVNVALHALTAALLFGVLARASGRPAPSFAVAALFAVHPLRVESVAWAAERKDVLCGLLWMLTLAAHLRYARRPGPGRWLAVAGCLGLALAAKPMAVTLPLVLLLLDWWPLNRLAPGGRGPAALLAEKAPLAAAAAAAALVALRAQESGGALATLGELPAADRVANALVALVAYPGRAALPFDLAVYYPVARRSLGDPLVLGAAGLVLAATLVAARLRRTHPWLLAGWAWYLVTVAPVIGIVQVGGQALADRYTYLPLLGPLLALVWSAARHARSPRALGAAAAAAVVAFTLMTARQTAVWRDGRTLYGHAVAVTGGNQWALYNLGLAREAAGDRGGALAAYREATRLGPHPQARYALALALDADGDAAGAAAELRAALREAPGDPLLRWTLAGLLAREGDEAGAIEHLRELVRLRPERPEYAERLAALLARRGGAPR